MVDQITTHEIDAKDRLLSQYKNLPNWDSFIKCYAQQIQDLETVIYSFLEILDIDEMEGAQLDLIGEIIGQNREGNTDAIYRILLKTRIIINTSSGTTADIISGLNLLRGATPGGFREIFPAHLEFYVDDTLDSAIVGYIRAMLQKVAATGVKVDPVEVYDSETPFIFGSIARTPSEGGGFSSLANPTLGGKLGSLIE